MPLNNLIKSWRTLDMPLINCEVSLTLTWTKKFVLTDIMTRAAGEVNLPVIAAPTGANFKIKDTKLYIPAVTLSAEIYNNLLE